MPPVERMELNQKAVVWRADTVTRYDRYGNAKVGEADEINVRWTSVNRLVTDPQGVPIAITAEVVADEEIPVNSVMRLGKLIELPDPIDNLFRVAVSNVTPDIKNRETAYSVSLARLNDSLPDPSV